MDFQIDFNRKDPLHLQSLINEGNKHTSLESEAESNMIPIILSPKTQKLKEIAQHERMKKANLFNIQHERETQFNIVKLIDESIKRGIFPTSFTDENKLESELSVILDDIHGKLKISDLSIFVMTKLVYYKFYLLHPYDKLGPKFVVPAAFLFSAKLVSKFYKNQIIDKLIEYKFVVDKKSLFQLERTIVQALGPHMAYLEDPVKMIAKLCKEKTLDQNTEQKAYKVLPTLEPIRFQTWLSEDIANYAIKMAQKENSISRKDSASKSKSAKLLTINKQETKNS